MKLLLAALLLLSTATSCKKQPYRGCYVCQLDLNSEDYTDMGCYTNEDWDLTVIKDRTNTVILDKFDDCRLTP